MKNLLILLLLISTVTFAQKTEVRALEDFDAIALSIAGDVYITQGNTQNVELRGSEETLEKIETEVRGGKLIIETDNRGSWFNWNELGKVEIYITVKALDRVQVSGSGRVMTQNEFKTEEIDLDISGSGKISFSTNANYVEGTISGSGKIELKGSTNDFLGRISGSGNIDAENLISRTCEAKISGSGRMTIKATQEINARISGSGSIYYHGDPPKVHSSSSGSGKVKKVS